MQNLTKQEAIKVMMRGGRIRHRSFGASEWMELQNLTLVFEDGYELMILDFFADRQGSSWEDGYEEIFTIKRTTHD